MRWTTYMAIRKGPLILAVQHGPSKVEMAAQLDRILWPTLEGWVDRWYSVHRPGHVRLLAMKTLSPPPFFLPRKTVIKGPIRSSLYSITQRTPEERRDATKSGTQPPTLACHRLGVGQSLRGRGTGPGNWSLEVLPIDWISEFDGHCPCEVS